MTLVDKYTENLNMDDFKLIPEISSYNNNYYIGLNGDLLFGKSDDDDETEWYIVEYDKFILLGYSYCSGGELLQRRTD